MGVRDEGNVSQEGRCKAAWKRKFKPPWREAGPPNHHDDEVISDQEVVNKDPSQGWEPVLPVTARDLGTHPTRVLAVTCELASSGGREEGREGERTRDRPVKQSWKG